MAGKSEPVPGWLIVGCLAALAAAVIGLAARNAKGKKQYAQLVDAIQQLIEQARARAEGVADQLTDTGQDLAEDLKRRAREAKHGLG